MPQTLYKPNNHMSLNTKTMLPINLSITLLHFHIGRMTPSIQQASQNFAPQHIKPNPSSYAHRLNIQAQNEVPQASSSSCNYSGELTELIRMMLDKFNKLETRQDNLQSFVSEMANSKSEEKAKKGGLPSNIVMNPKIVNVMHLRSGKRVGYDYEEEVEEDGLSTLVHEAKYRGDMHVENHLTSLASN